MHSPVVAWIWVSIYFVFLSHTVEKGNQKFSVGCSGKSDWLDAGGCGFCMIPYRLHSLEKPFGSLPSTSFFISKMGKCHSCHLFQGKKQKRNVCKVNRVYKVFCTDNSNLIPSRTLIFLSESLTRHLKMGLSYTFFVLTPTLWLLCKWHAPFKRWEGGRRKWQNL